MNSINIYNRFEILLRKHSRVLSRVQYLLTLIGVIIVLLGMIELFSFIGVSVYAFANKGVLDSRVRLGIYEDKEWIPEYFRELQGMTAEYYPYVGHRTKPNYHGKYIHLDHTSRRKTLFQCPGAPHDTMRIFMFGGSTLWGVGARDEGTIASQLAKEFCAAGRKVEITNFGESGFQSTQEMILLLLELRKKNIPDVVIMYDGVNDVFSAYQHNEAGIPQNTQNRKADFDSRNRLRLHDLWKFFPHTRKVLDKLREEIYDTQFRTTPLNDTLIQESVDVYTNNIKIVRLLGKAYGFKSFFFWQPSLYTKQHLSEEEKNTLEHDALLDKSYRNVSALIASYPEIIDLSGIFDIYTSTIFIDWAHTIEEANAVIAQKMMEAMIKNL